ncbi:alpha/beta hydrolase [Caulobacter soli]|uniref:alpha/beta hydrolase n=1 Tax=Caulobacter soli TaxID=2708539 RepID=UPI0013EBF775|nr:alpha/beta hydrolase [Caulobacter soli]
MSGQEVGLNRRAFGAGAALSLLAAGGARAGAASDPRGPADWSGVWPPKDVIPLWPGDPPGWRGGVTPVLPPDWPPNFLRGTAKPTLNVFRPDRPNGQALLVCPGGAYMAVSAANEGVDVARVFNAMDVTVFVLSYRLPGEGWDNRADVPLQDAQRAMRLIRTRAAAYGIRPEGVGVLGFSAGGHLAATLATDHAEPVYAPIDAADRRSARPAFAGLIYPVIAMSGPNVHARSRDQLLGGQPSVAAMARRSPASRVSDTTPPCFVAHAVDDTTVSVENSLEMLVALRAAKTRCEGHVFEVGQHAFGVGRPGEPTELWPQLFARWISRA